MNAGRVKKQGVFDASYGTFSIENKVRDLHKYPQLFDSKFLEAYPGIGTVVAELKRDEAFSRRLGIEPEISFVGLNSIEEFLTYLELGDEIAFDIYQSTLNGMKKRKKQIIS